MHRIAHTDIGNSKASANQPIASIVQRRFNGFGAAHEKGFIILHGLRELAVFGLQPCIAQHNGQREGEGGITAVQPVKIGEIVWLIRAEFQRCARCDALADGGAFGEQMAIFLPSGDRAQRVHIFKFFGKPAGWEGPHF